MTVQEHLKELQAKKAKLEVAIAAEISGGSQEWYVAKQRLETAENNISVLEQLFSKTGVDQIKQALEEKKQEKAALVKLIEIEQNKPSQECLILQQQLASVVESIESLEAIAATELLDTADNNNEQNAVCETTAFQDITVIQEKLKQAINSISEIANIAEIENYSTEEIDAILGKLSRLEFIPQCCGNKMVKNGNQQGKRRYRCQNCGRTLSEDNAAKGRRKQYASNAEKQRAYRQRTNQQTSPLPD